TGSFRASRAASASEPGGGPRPISTHRLAFRFERGLGPRHRSGEVRKGEPRTRILLVLLRPLYRIGPTRVAKVEHQVLDRLVRGVEVVVPPPAIVHEGLARGVILSAHDPYRPRLVVRRQHALEHVDEGRHAELLFTRLSAWLELHGGPRDEERRVHGGRESSEGSDQPGDLDPLRLRRLLSLRARGRAGESHHEQTGCGSDKYPHDHRCPP